ncbi:diguanylate cyclase [Pleionea sp. CnH1-48]|uniref:ligand-binding sensor domain-containing diguanylate cyclase n=1 Tax=Pleionea sp. CnH1-48 TaxID=2954494 RepID=UPI0020976A24|nr:diguanylate cyclase [Pleionea sp. CnH1-48]MCO7224880.1 diguanylate cyclase [Pleionea sp. CnH1-48]
MFIKSFLFSFLLCFCYVSVAKDIFERGELYFEGVGDRESIPLGIVTALIQDQDGFIWIGSQNGLIKYDGYRYTHYEHSRTENSIGGNYVRSLWQAPDGSIWIGTRSDGVSIFHLDSREFSHLKHMPDNSVIDHDVRAISGDEDGNVFIGTNRGLIHVNYKTDIVTSLVDIKGCESVLKAKRIRSLLVDKDRNLWVGASLGLCRVSLDSLLSGSSAKGYEYTHYLEETILQLYEDALRSLWVGSSKTGLSVIDPIEKKVTVLPEAFAVKNNKLPLISAITQPSESEIWVATFGDGIHVFNAESKDAIRRIEHDPAVKSSVSLNNIGAMLVDRSGLVWVGTWGGGLDKINLSNGALRTLRYSPLKKSITHTDINAFLEMEDGSLWVGTWGNGIDIFDPEGNMIGGHRADTSLPNKLQDNFINSMSLLSNGRVWIATRSGLYEFYSELNTFKMYSQNEGLINDEVHTLYPDSSGNLWLGTRSGLSFLDTKNNQFHHVNQIEGSDVKMEHSVSSIVETQAGFWIGTQNGLFFLADHSKKLVSVNAVYERSLGLSDNAIKGMMVDHADKLWVSTEMGLDRLISWDGSIAKFESINDKVQLPSKFFGGNLIEDDIGRIWTFDYMIDPSSWNSYKLDKSVGWDVGTIWSGSYYKMKSGLILQGGSHGVLMLKPKLWKEWDYQPKLALSHFSIDNIDMSTYQSNNIILQPKVKSFSIEFTSQDYSYPKRNRYAYKLKGYDDAWIETSSNNRRVSYTNLPPGEYVLLIKGSNRIGQWSIHELEIPITQMPMWYETLTFRGLFSLVVVFSILWVFRRRVKILQMQKEELDVLVKSRTENIELLGTIGQEITASRDIEDIFHRVYLNVSQLMDTHVFLVGLINKERQRIDIKFYIENGMVSNEFFYELNDTNRPAVWCVSQRKELLINMSDELYQYVDVIQAPVAGGMSESVVYMPLMMKNEVLGCLSVQSLEKNKYDSHDVRILKTISAYASIAVDHAMAHDSLKKASLIDFLTQLPNRRAFTDKAEFLLKGFARQPNPMSFAIADIDHFKAVNDTYGHDCGDLVLKKVAETFKERLREQDVVARWGGEEFVFMFPNTDVHGATVLLESLRQELEKVEVHYGEAALKVSATFGVGQVQDNTELEAIIDKIDAALYQGKQTGRNKVVSE